MKTARLVVVLSLVAAVLAAPASTSAASKPKSVIVALDTQGKQRWKIVPGDRNVTVLGEYDGVLVTVGSEACNVPGGVMRGFDAKSGKSLWKRGIANPVAASRLFPASAPSDESVVPIVGPAGGLIGIDVRTGKQVWSRDRVSEGASGPLSDAGDVIVRGDEKHVVAFSRATGATIWDVPLASNGFETPADAHAVLVFTPTEAAPRQQRVIFTALDVRTGAQLWQLARVVDFGSSATPVAAGDGLFFVSTAAMPGTVGDLIALDTRSGDERWRLTNYSDYTWQGIVSTTERVLADVGGSVTAVRPADGSVEWTGPHESVPILDFTADPARAYYVANLRIHALAAATGKPLWTWRADPTLSRGGAGVTLASRGIYVDEQPPTKDCGD